VVVHSQTSSWDVNCTVRGESMRSWKTGAGHEGEFVFEEGSVVDRLPDVDWMREETAVIWDLRDAGVWGVETAFAVCGAGGGESEVCA
jgi:hypothetical protein